MIQFLLLLLIALPLFKTIFSMLKNRDLYLNRQIVERIAAGFSTKYRTAIQMNREIYGNEHYREELYYLLRNGLIDYYSFRLDKYYAEESFSVPKLEQVFTSYLDLFPEIQQIALYSFQEQFGYRYEKEIQQLLARQVMTAKLSLRDPNNPFLPIHSIRTSGEDELAVYSICLPVMDSSNREELGLIFVDFKQSALTEVYSEYSAYVMGEISILSGDALVFSSPEAPELPSQAPPPVYTIKVPCPDISNCFVIQKIASQSLRSQHRVVFLLVYLLLAVFISTSILFMVWLTHKVNSRTRTIIQAMMRFQGGNLGVRLQVAQKDEFGTIARSFNRMGEEIEEYIKKTYVLKLAQKEAEMSQLESQINPHFLNNTLETIRMKALSEGSHQAAEMIFHLARIFRNMYQQQEHLVPLSHELRLCREYLRICELRYGPCFQLILDMEEAYGEIRILKFLLQPVVENYILHGMDRGRKNNRLRIFCTKENQSLVIGFRDDGRGIPAEKLARIEAALSHPESQHPGSGLGLLNVHRRVRIAYGKGYGLRIASSPGQGTEILLTLPLPGGN